MSDRNTSGHDPLAEVRQAFDHAETYSEEAAETELVPWTDAGGPVSREVVERCAQQPLNDTGNAARLLAHFGDQILHVRDVGWHRWTGTHWELQGGPERVIWLAQIVASRIKFETAFVAHTSAEELAIARARSRPSETADADDMAKAAAVQKAQSALAARRNSRGKFGVSSGNQSRLKAMIEQAIPHKQVAPDELDRDPHALNLLNGTLRFVREPDPECPDPDVTRLRWAVRLDEHDPSDLITKVAPTDFNEDATCPEWDAFMTLFQPKDPVRSFLQDYHGYALTGLTGEQVVVYNYGTGANGKSSFIEAMCRLMGPFAATLNPESITGENQRRGDQATPDFASLPGARFVRVSELERGVKLREALIKSLTGGEPMQVRHLHQGFFTFRPTFKAAMSGNDLPSIGGVDHGIWRRIRVVPWEIVMADDRKRQFEDVQQAFERERPGILNWLITGALRYLEAGRLATPSEVKQATSDYRDEMDPVGRFADCCVEREPGQRVAAQRMYEAYAAWCGANGVKAYSMTAFGRIMPQKGFIKTDGRVRHYLDVRLHELPEPLSDPPRNPSGGPLYSAYNPRDDEVRS